MFRRYIFGFIRNRIVLSYVAKLLMIATLSFNGALYITPVFFDPKNWCGCAPLQKDKSGRARIYCRFKSAVMAFHEVLDCRDIFRFLKSKTWRNFIFACLFLRVLPCRYCRVVLSRKTAPAGWIAGQWRRRSARSPSPPAQRHRW